MFPDKRKKAQQDVALVLPLASVSSRQEAEVAFMFCLKKHHKGPKAGSTWDLFSLSALRQWAQQMHCYYRIHKKLLALISWLLLLSSLCYVLSLNTKMFK